MSRPPGDSVWRLHASVLSARVLIRLSTVRKVAEPTPEAHLYLANLYDRLSHVHRMRARHRKAKKYARLAAAHYRAGGWNGPPFNAAPAMPRPRRWVIVEAVGQTAGSAEVA